MDQDITEEGAESGAFCPHYRRAVELIGRRWTGAILRAMLSGVERFSDLAATIPGLSDRMLSERLKELESEGLVVRTVLDEGAARWPLEVEKGWLRIAQEALSNVERHARAGRVEIGLRQRGDRLLLWVRDDGVGFPVRAGRPLKEGLGFLGMRERAALLGGALRVCSGSGLAGTLILARVRRAPAAS